MVKFIFKLAALAAAFFAGVFVRYLHEGYPTNRDKIKRDSYAEGYAEGYDHAKAIYADDEDEAEDITGI